MQKTIGIIGGITYVSTTEYYRLINEGVQKKLGGVHSAKIILHSMDFGIMNKYQYEKRWDLIVEILIQSRESLERAGADLFCIAANTPHKYVREVCATSKIPFVNIVDCCALRIKQSGFKKALLMGTPLTMNDGFYADVLRKYGIECEIPAPADQDVIESIIFEEVAKHTFHAGQGTKLAAISQKHQVDCVIMGCTEIPLVFSEKNTQIPLMDTLRIHVDAIVEEILKDEVT